MSQVRCKKRSYTKFLLFTHSQNSACKLVLYIFAEYELKCVIFGFCFMVVNISKIQYVLYILHDEHRTYSHSSNTFTKVFGNKTCCTPFVYKSLQLRNPGASRNLKSVQQNKNLKKIICYGFNLYSENYFVSSGD